MTSSFVRGIAELVHLLIHAYIFVILVRSVISWMGNIRPNQFVMLLRRLTDPVFRFVHKHLPFTVVGGIDISPIIIIVALYILDNLVVGGLLSYARHIRLGG